MQNPLSYTICINVVKGHLVVSQPDLGLFNGKTKFEAIKRLPEIGELVGEMMLQVKRELERRGEEVPPPCTPKEALCIPSEEWLSTKEAADYLGISESTMRRMCDSETVPSKRKARGKYRRILKRDLDHYKRTGGIDEINQESFPFMEKDQGLADFISALAMDSQ